MLLGARTLAGAPGIATRRKKLLGKVKPSEAKGPRHREEMREKQQGRFATPSTRSQIADRHWGLGHLHSCPVQALECWCHVQWTSPRACSRSHLSMFAPGTSALCLSSCENRCLNVAFKKGFLYETVKPFTFPEVCPISTSLSAVALLQQGLSLQLPAMS